MIHNHIQRHGCIAAATATITVTKAKNYYCAASRSVECLDVKKKEKQKSEINVRRIELNRQHLFVLSFDVWYDERARARSFWLAITATEISFCMVADAATCATHLIVVTLNVQSNCNPTMRRRPKRERE